MKNNFLQVKVIIWFMESWIDTVTCFKKLSPNLTT